MACDVDTGAVFKHPVHCFDCDQTFYFTLRKIAEAQKIVCPLCGSDINLTDQAYGFFATSVKQTIDLRVVTGAMGSKKLRSTTTNGGH